MCRLSPAIFAMRMLGSLAGRLLCAVVFLGAARFPDDPPTTYTGVFFFFAQNFPLFRIKTSPHQSAVLPAVTQPGGWFCCYLRHSWPVHPAGTGGRPPILEYPPYRQKSPPAAEISSRGRFVLQADFQTDLADPFRLFHAVPHRSGCRCIRARHTARSPAVLLAGALDGSLLIGSSS